MKNIFFIVLPVLFFSCLGNSTPNEESENSEEGAEIIKPKKAFIPGWVEELYPEARTKYEDKVVETQEIMEFNQLNDSVSICRLNVESYGICSKVYLTVQINKVEKDSLQIEKSCDHDLSVSKYEWQVFEKLKPTVYKVVNYIESVPEEYLDKNGELLKGRSFDGQENEMDSIVQIFEIKPDGTIFEQLANKK